MRFAQGQLKETLKILTYEFVSSVQKMCALHHRQLNQNKQQLFIKILQTIQVEGKSNFVEDCVKILEGSYDEKIKNQCFEKDFSISQNHSVEKNSPSFDQSDSLDHKDCFDQIDEKLKKDQLNRQQSNEITKYNQDCHQNFFINEKLMNKSHKLIHDQPQIDHQSQLNSQSSQSSSDSDFQNSYPPNHHSIKKEYTTKSTPKTGSSKKKYRSYTQQERQQAVGFAHELGVEQTSKLLMIPKKNITRWMKRTEKAQKIRGRKPGNPNMEENLTNWIFFNIDAGNYLTQTQIRNKARYFSGVQNFKASKGWLQKYFRRNKAISNGLNELLAKKRAKSMCAMKNQDRSIRKEEIQ